MGCSRESQNLFFCIRDKNWRRFWWLLKRFDKATRLDTFMPIVCWFLGHKKYQPEPKFEPNEWSCKRCYRWIK